mmetsp:Transcript_74892/g.200875  ORF Transcript_74892/g.200875 Transcript_74892/m.200875 type:complete len:133 (-) Transcript_74892:112-510(-)
MDSRVPAKSHARRRMKNFSPKLPMQCSGHLSSHFPILANGHANSWSMLCRMTELYPMVNCTFEHHSEPTVHKISGDLNSFHVLKALVDRCYLVAILMDGVNNGITWPPQANGDFPDQGQRQDLHKSPMSERE